MKITKKLTYQPPQSQSADMGCSMKMMDYMMPLMSTFITFSVPAVIAVYWIYNNILSTLQQFILKVMYPVPVFTEEDYKNAEREMNKGIKQPKKKANTGKRAAHRIDLDEPIEATATETETEAASEPKKSKGHDLIAPAEIKDESDKKND
jgi:YidC/Oxa1 family membrane protein insertase